MHNTFLMMLAIYLALGIGAGFISGILGAGGGVIVVPGLLWLFHYTGAVRPDIAMHVAVATSLATMICVSARSLLSHMKHRIHFLHVYKKLAAGIIVGVIGGSILAHYLHSRVLQIAFGIFVLCMAVLLLVNRKEEQVEDLPNQFWMSMAGGLIGLKAGLFGIAASAFSVPFLTYRGVRVHVAVVVSVAIALTVSIFGALTFVLTGLEVSNLPNYALGYVYLPAWVGLSIGGVFVAPLGAKISHLIPGKILKICFAGFCVVIGLKMLLH